MPVIISYMLKVSISLSVVYLFYFLILRRLTFYNWNRWYLLVYSILSFFIPFIDINPALERNNLGANSFIQMIPDFAYTNEYAHNKMTGSGQVSFWIVAIVVVAVGMMLLTLRLLLQYFSYRNIFKNSRLLATGKIKLYEVDTPVIPFSFGRSVFINSQYNEDEQANIIRHEFVHVRQRHTIDIIWSELLCILNWYNPFVWLLRKDIRQNLEFIADENVLESGIDKRQYQYLLLRVTGNNAFGVASNFNFSSLKKRIAMMNKIRSAKKHLIKFFFILPLVAIMLVAFRSKKKGITIKSENKTAVDLYNNGVKQSGLAIDTPPQNQLPRDYVDFLKRNPDIKSLFKN